MAIRLTCQCGAVLQVTDDAAGKSVACPKCQAITSAPLMAPIFSPPDIPESPFRTTVRPDDITRNEPAERKAGRKRRRQARMERQQGVDRLNFGLGFHYASPFVALASVLTGGVALGLMLAAQNSELAKLEPPARFFLITSNVFLLLAALLEIPVTVFALALSDGAFRGLVLGSLGLRCVAVALAILSLILPDASVALTAVALTTLLASWVVWVIALRRVGVFLGQAGVKEGTMQNLKSGLLTLAGGLVSLFALVLVAIIIASLKYPFARSLVGVIALSMFGGIVKIAAVVREADSFFGFLLAPTGVPFVWSYYELISGLRVVLDRRA
jgi:hypothetical protein